MGILRLFAGIPTPVELFGDFLLKRLDANTFVGFLIRFAPNPKTTPPGLTLLAMIAVGTMLSLVYAAIVRIPLPTSKCGHLMSTAVWQGVPFSSLLQRHGGTMHNAAYMVFYSVDGYTISQSLNEILSVNTLLAWRMNGAELPMRHGYPMRVLIPGHYGEENPKWVTRVELTDHFVGGLYSDQGWYNGPLHITSRIDIPTEQVVVGHQTEVGGVAYGGSNGIQKVEVSTDGGTTWNTATLQTPLSQDAWVLWTWQWTPPTARMYTLVVRCTDVTGQLQTSNVQSTVPSDGEGYHKVKVSAA
jgi:DMSO/TMAO reductase YedYZ molybdopterin-dependent catalytic subunit